MSIQLQPEQSLALDAIIAFMNNPDQDAFILRGSAGTGKTTLIAQLVSAIAEMNLSCSLMAPTGRAARILSNKITQMIGSRAEQESKTAAVLACPDSGVPLASTIHATIYTRTDVELNEEAESANDPGVRIVFGLKKDEPLGGLFIIDESSMVGDKEAHGDFMQFGSGRLLKDLVTYARIRRQGRATDNLPKLLFVGDPAQLPPVGENSSPALSEAYLRSEFSLRVGTFDLLTVMRQARGSSILDRATALRDAIRTERFNTFSLKPDGQEIVKVETAVAVERVVQSIRAKDTTVVVVQSNATALDYNRNVRQQLWGDASLPMQSGDTLLINRNSPLHMLSNGDLVKVMQVAPQAMQVSVPLKGGHHVELRFRDVSLAFRAGDGSIVQTQCFLLENLLDSPHRELTALELRALLVDFRRRNPELRAKTPEFNQAIRTDPFFNALQVKFGYAMTCHKAQGGEWNTVIVDFPAGAGVRHAGFFRWAYTAITRASRTLMVVSPPDFTALSGLWAESTNPAVGAPTADIAAVDPFISDPDWHRFSFSAATAPLMHMHQQLRAAWEAQGIHAEQLQHLQYCERYTVTRQGKRASLQYYYDKKHKLSRAASVPRAGFDETLADDALAVLHALAGKPSSSVTAVFLQEFLDLLDASLAGSSIRRTDYKAMPYRLRVSFADGHRQGDIDFTYDGTETWTNAVEVGTPGSSMGLYEAIQRSMLMHQALQ
ncbi:AAA family ATPase [Pigmentiphaga aceris]|uniref:AAA family ATPase n=1 Tax=Pigmentiphaga aceris TaxID=1940612 RepID=A0A5C0AXY6_9BURK|nr:AAA family ATPase [Pigmentiphaga aceris]QEI06596.1 AAA family ATPase [Pigmentiphaga aceris]